MNKIVVTSYGRIYQLKIRDEADSSVAAEIFKLKEYRIVDETIKNAIDPIVDIGAHSGLFSLYARSINPSVRIVAVEPEADNLTLLRQHILDNDVKNVEIIDCAIAAETGMRKLIISGDSHNHKLAPKGVKDNLKARTVNALALSDLLKKCIINHVGLLKMDIEGAEHEIFESITPETFRIISAVIMEYHNDGKDSSAVIEGILRENGFGVQVFPSKFDKKLGFIFALNKRH